MTSLITSFTLKSQFSPGAVVQDCTQLYQAPVIVKPRGQTSGLEANFWGLST